MKGSWVTTFAVGGVLLILTLFIGLPYNWLAQASEAERERMQRRVDADTKAFADDLNREVQAAYFSFQVGPESIKNKDWSEFNERYEYWRSKTQYPELISEILYFGNGEAPLRFDQSVHSFVPAEIGEPITQLRAKIENSTAFQSFYDEPLALVMPIHKSEAKLDGVMMRRVPDGAARPLEMPARIGSIVIVLDRSVLNDRLMPALYTTHFPEGNFHVAVTRKDGSAVYEPAGPIANGDANAGLLSLAPDNLMLLGNRGMWSKIQGEQRQGVVINQHVESKTFTRSAATTDDRKTGTFTFELKTPNADGHGAVKSRTSVIATATNGGDPWTLKVQHAAGSIDAFTKGEFRKSFLIGLGVYLLLVGAIAAIILSALRSKRFAQRQIDFVSSVSHEFRTPLAVIYSAGENLADGVANDAENVTRYGSLIKGEGKKLSAMVEQILQFAGARSGKKRYNFSETKAGDIVTSALNECLPLLDNANFTLETDIDSELPPLKADADALSSALQNLITNSVKYSNSSPWLRVKASNGNGTVKFSVEDNGIGIDAADIKHVFEPFYRSRNVVDAQIHGNGLGLAIVKEIAEAHGGKVRVTSEAGKGSKFTIEVPQR